MIEKKIDKLNYYLSYFNIIAFTSIFTYVITSAYKYLRESNITYILFILGFISVFFIYNGFKTIRTYKVLK